jgi:putative endonuclease
MPNSDPRRALGRTAEEQAAVYLEKQGYTILVRNWRTRHGEVDIVARDGIWLVFVEVRARRGDVFGGPEESVTPRKQTRLAALADAYLAECGWDGPWRIDVLAFRYRTDGSLVALNHLRDAVGGPC